MVKIKFCGLTRPDDILEANRLKPDYAGFVFAKKSRRFVNREQALELKKMLDPGITAVGVFTDEQPETVAELLKTGVIDIAQLHGNEDDEYIKTLRHFTDKPLIQAFRIKNDEDIRRSCESKADYILLDSGQGTGKCFDWKLLEAVNRPYFLAGGLNPENVREAVVKLVPFAVDVSSGIETDGVKDKVKMQAFAINVREAQRS